VIETALTTVSEQLRGSELRDLLKGLPQGEPHKISKPSGPPSSWPETAGLRARGDGGSRNIR